MREGAGEARTRGSWVLPQFIRKVESALSRSYMHELGPVIARDRKIPDLEGESYHKDTGVVQPCRTG